MNGPAQGAVPEQGLISIGLRFVLLAVVALVLMIVDHRGEHLRPARELLGLAVYPIQVVVDLPFTAYEALSGTFIGRQALKQENERLKRRQLTADYQLQELESLKVENARLRMLLESKDRQEGRVLVAEILSIDLDPYPQRFLINRGSLDDVFIGQPLLDAAGVVGQIASVSPMTAEVILITDANHAVPVSVLRNGIRTIAVGTGDSNLLRLPYLTNSADIEVGDTLITSGLGGVFPSGRPVAEVTEVREQPGQSFAEIVARPLSALDRDQEVILVWNGDEIVPENAAVNFEAAR